MTIQQFKTLKDGAKLWYVHHRRGILPVRLNLCWSRPEIWSVLMEPMYVTHSNMGHLHEYLADAVQDMRRLAPTGWK